MRRECGPASVKVTSPAAGRRPAPRSLRCHLDLTHQRSAGPIIVAALTTAGAAAAAAAALLAATALANPPIASATPPSGIAARELGAITVGGTTVAARRIVFAPGGTTGWHSHEGPVYALTTRGTLDRTLADCSTVTSLPGDLIIEHPGPHIGTAQGPEPVILWAVYVDPVGAPLADDVPAVDCPGG